ncbi:MAG: multifunctional CCA tRNA nucleotidyl transferase/2'3'-cyclic phosphodiesterase/2'nucleotidase/phosphatase [Burkholderiaceae bacterium]
MQVYLVGGAVRDSLLGLAVKDRDWVVVGATPQQMVALGYRPVGRDFPVFLHPQTHEEYALARTERKTAPGYRGFAVHAAPDVTLEQDLARRDLTINAMAVAAADVHDATGFDPSGATLIDPWNGKSDLQHKLLRHVTDAFREDPVRILRVARFAARFPDFSVAPETTALTQSMVAHGEAGALVAERVWQELARGLMEARPSRLCEVLLQSGAWQAVLPELIQTGAGDDWKQLLRRLDLAAAAGAALPVRYVCLCLRTVPPHGQNAATWMTALESLGTRLRVPTDCQALTQVTVRELPALHAVRAFDAAGIVALLERCDAFRKPERFEQMLQAWDCFARAAPDPALTDLSLLHMRLTAALAAAQSVPTEAVALAAQVAGLTGPQVGERVRVARVVAVSSVLP